MITTGKDYMKTNLGNHLTGLYYYGLSPNTFGTNQINTKIFGYVPTIQSITYNPFIDMDDPNIGFFECNFDGEFFHWEDGTLPKVYRLFNGDVFTRLLGSFDLKSWYENQPSDVETRMLHYPFRYFALTDYMNPPLIMKLENIGYDNQGKVNIKVKVGLSNSSKYILFADGYKGDNNGNLEGIVNNNPLQYPVLSSAYAQFMATQGNSYTNNQALALAENNKDYNQVNQSIGLQREQSNINNIGGLIGGISSLFAGQIGSGIGQIAGAGVNAITQNKVFNQQNQFNQQNFQFKEHSIESSALAMKKDLFNTPRAIKTIGNDAMFTINNANKRVDLLEYGLKPINEMKLKNYFKRYGVATNTYKVPNIRNRRYWNFVKCGKCNIDSPNIPHNDLLKLQNIFESGITLWHVDRGAIIKDYTMNNEVI